MFVLPRKIRYRTATEAWEEFFFREYHGLERIWRWLSFECGTLPLNLFPLPHSGGFSGSLKYIGKLADCSSNILIFPEGGHSSDGSLQAFQPVLGIIVKELSIPVVPIKISGTRKSLASTVRFPNSGKVTITFVEPLYFLFEEPGAIVARTRQAVE